MMRRSIFTFLQNFHHLSSTPSLLLLPFAVSTLLSPPLTASSYLFPLVHGRLRSLFLAAGIPPQSELFAVLNLKLSQTILSFIFSLPFTLSFLLLAKAAIIRLLHHHHHHHDRDLFSWIKTLNRLLITQICSSLLILSANATCFCLLAISFNISDVLGLSSPRFQLLVSATGAIIYSIVLANAYIICSLGMIASAAEGCSGFSSILKAVVVIRGRTSTALSLAVPVNMALAAVEALFQYRVVRAYNRAMRLDSPMVFESILVAYLYAMILVLDTVVGYVFLKSCRAECQNIHHHSESKDFESVL
ncbi:hypothetical protein C2S51_028869 [Perilla frutescens var. frutescens]|nr:hypothetical protein C2S51_028869 [Perilla frutescens var. frutescens]